MPLILVRHAEAVTPTVNGPDENVRPLNRNGLRQAQALASELSTEGITAIYSSPHLRARQTVEPLGARLGLEIETVDDLRECRLSPGWLPDWRVHVERAWDDASYAPPRGESHAEAQARMVAAVRKLIDRHRGQTVVAASHGTVIALALRHLRPAEVGLGFWAEMPMPAFFRIEALPG